jgi:hypothetical protein
LFGAGFATVLGVGAMLGPTCARADLHVGGNPKAVTIDAQNSSIKEILAELGKSFDVHVQSTADLNKQITGTYEGSLSKVLIRLLEGYNVILKTGHDGIQLTVLGTKNASGTVTVSPAPSAADSTAQGSQPSLAVNNAETPAATTPLNVSRTVILLAEGTAPPVPSGAATDAAPNPMQVAPSTVAPPTPVVGATPSVFPLTKATTNLPPVSSGATPGSGPVPKPSAGTATAPLAK